jgi:hypothetical protein
MHQLQIQSLETVSCISRQHFKHVSRSKRLKAVTGKKGAAQKDCWKRRNGKDQTDSKGASSISEKRSSKSVAWILGWLLN